MRYIVHEFVGEDAITFDDGQSVYEKIKPELVAGREVTLDFNDVSVFASPFFNAAIGQLLKEIKAEDLNRFLRIESLNPTGHEVLRRVIENAKKYYASKDYREAQTKVLQQMGEAD
jgi:STAS-like domain of unknown function (DUF4325)